MAENFKDVATCRSAQKQIKRNRSLSNLLRRRKDSLKPQKRGWLTSFFEENPQVEFKEKLCELPNKESHTLKRRAGVQCNELGAQGA